MAVDTIGRGMALRSKARIDTLNASARKLWLPARVRQREVMASPPTPTLTTALTIASPRAWPSVNPNNGATAHRINPLFRYRRGSANVIAGTSAPNYSFTKLTGVNYGGGTLSSNEMAVAVLTDAAEIEFLFLGNGFQLFAKVDGQYISLSATTLPNDGSFYYYYLNLGSTALREIEVMASGGASFGGIYTTQTATVIAAHPRGPRTIVLWDSFGEGSGGTVGIDRAIHSMADALGWDDVRSDSVGSTGYLATTGSKLTYRQRLATDVLPFNPELLLVCTSINDSAQSPAAVAAEAQALVSTVKTALPNCQVVLTSMMANKGGGAFPAANYLVSDAVKGVATSLALPFIDLLEQPLPDGFSLETTTLAAGATAAATSLSVTGTLCPGSTYRFADGSHVFVRSVSGSGPYTATIDYLSNTQSSGAVLTPCGNSIWSGSGRVGATTGFGNCDLVVSSDNTHPSDAGHRMIGTALANGLLGVWA